MFVHFSENPPSLERLEARLCSPLDLRGLSKEECVEQSPFLLLLALLLRDLLDDGLLLSNGVCSSNLNFAVTLVTWLAPMLGEEHLDDPLLEPLAGTVEVSTVM